MDIVNAALSAGNANDMFVTLCLATLDLSTAQADAMCAPAMFRRFIRNGSDLVTRLQAPGGPPLGLFEGIVYQQDTVLLSDNDRVLIVTDGFTEANDPAGELFGQARIEDFMSSFGGRRVEPAPRPGQACARLRGADFRRPTTWPASCFRSARRRP